MDGLPFRKLANQYDLTPMGVYKIVKEELRSLPKNAALSKEYCDRFGGVLNVDGKFIQIRGREKKIPFIYCIDYTTHDIPAGILAEAESTEAFSRLVSMLQEIKYPLRAVICDDSTPLRNALAWRFPKIPVQLCQTHYLENVRQMLEIRTDGRYRGLFYEFCQIFKKDKSFNERMFILQTLEEKYREFDPVLLPLFEEVRHRYNELFAYERVAGLCPHSNNMIEAFNSHLNGRLETVKGFESFANAELWLNAWMIRRRTKPFTDCEAPFTHLNGKMSLEMTIDLNKEFPKLYTKKDRNLS